MALRVFEFQCVVCEEIQEQFVSNRKGLAEDPCKKCAAEADQLRRLIAVPGHGGHLSWSKWRR